MTAVLHDLRIYSFVLMSNHFHLIVSTPRENISEAMKRFMELTSKRIGERSKRINRIWGARHYKTVLGSYSYFLNAYKYVYFNPVKAEIVSRCEDYRYSTLSGLLGKEKLLLPLQEDTLLFGDTEETLAWLNTHPSPEQLFAIRSALKKARFEHVKCPNSRKPILGEDEVI